MTILTGKVDLGDWGIDLVSGKAASRLNAAAELLQDIVADMEKDAKSVLADSIEASFPDWPAFLDSYVGKGRKIELYFFWDLFGELRGTWILSEILKETADRLIQEGRVEDVVSMVDDLKAIARDLESLT